MKVLVIAPWVPGKVRPRSLGLLRHLAKSHEVRVVAAGDPSSAGQIEGIGKLLTVKMALVPALARVLMACLTGRSSLQQAYMNAPGFRRAIRDQIAEFQPDVCYFNVLRTAQFADEASGILRIIDLDEFRSGYYRRMASHGAHVVWRLIARVEGARMEVDEEKVLASFDRVLVSSPADLRATHGHVRLVRSPHLMAPGTHPAPAPAAAVRPSIVFAGRQSYRANHEAITWFVKEVLPLVRQEMPDVLLTIVGADPRPAVRRMASDDIQVTGWVDDVSSYYAQADVAIVPVELATGVQMKMIESLSLAVPTIVTSVVARGAGIARDDGVCLVADSRQEWADAVLLALRSPELRGRLAEAGAAWSRAHHGDHAVLAACDEALEGTGLVP